MPSSSAVFLRLLVGELGTPKLFPMANGYTRTEHGMSDLDQRCLKMRISKDGCTFPPTIFAPTPKIAPKPHFLGTIQSFNAKPIILRALRKSHVYGATKLKLYSYIGIGKYLGVFQNFSARGRPGAQGPLM